MLVILQKPMVLNIMKLLLLIAALSYSQAYSSLRPLPSKNGLFRLNTATLISAIPEEVKETAKILPCGDDLDKRILTLVLPAVANFLILPLVGAVDTFWVGRMGNALSLAGQGAANQVFSSVFFLISFLPAVVTPLVAKAAGSGDIAAVRDSIQEAFFLGSILGLFGTVLLAIFPSYALTMVLPRGSPARAFAEPYLAIRALTFMPALLSTIGFAAFRGTMDVVTPLKIAFFSNIVNVILDPVLIFNANMGVAGAAAATCAAEIFSFVQYVRLLQKKKMLQLSKAMKIPSFSSLKPLLVGGFGVQMRSVALNVAYLAVTRSTQAMDTTGTAAAAHAVTIQLWQLGGVVLLAMSVVASIIVPSEITGRIKEGKNKVEALESARSAANRLLSWGVIMGGILGLMQLACLPLLNIFSPLPDVQKAARIPSIIG
jgi:MATE family multidrug resistance protein